MSVPKVLILGQTFNKKEGGGVTMSNLFQGWPKDRIAVASNANLSKDTDYSVCETYYQLGYNNKLHPFPLNLVLPKIKCGLLSVQQGSTESSGHNNAAKSGKFKAIYQQVLRLLHFLGLYNVWYKLKMTPDFEQWLKQYNPDIIYTQLASLELIRFTALVRQTIDKPVVIHMMDDWPSTISNSGLFKHTWHKTIDRELRSLINNAALLLSISNSMATEYKKRYGREFSTFHNPIDIDFWKSYQRNDYSLPDQPVILYAGRIGKGINRSLETMAHAISIVKEKLKIDIQFVIQSPDKPNWVKNFKNLEYRAPVPYAELPRVFAEADFLYLPYDFSADSISFIKYSMPTKAPEYMVSGTPVLMFAPEETELVINALTGNWAKVVTRDDTEKLAAAIMELLVDEHARMKIARQAVSIAESSYNANQIRSRFKDIMSSVVFSLSLHKENNERGQN